MSPSSCAKAGASCADRVPQGGPRSFGAPRRMPTARKPMNDSIAKNMKDNRNFWNDAARSGAIIGAVLGVSALVESQMALSGNLRWFAWLVVEYLVVIALHFWLLYRFTRRRSQLYSAEEGFTFGEAYKFLLTVSAFGGAIAGAVQALYGDLGPDQAGRHRCHDGEHAFADLRPAALRSRAVDRLHVAGRHLVGRSVRTRFRPDHRRRARTSAQTVRHAHS